MKKLLFFCLLLLISSPIFAQSKDEKAIAEAVENLRKAMIDPDKAMLEEIAATDLSYGHSNGLLEDKAAFVDALVSNKSDFVSIDLSEQTIKIVGNTALVRHKLAAQTNNGGKPGSTKLSILLVWQKQKGSWRLLARQAVKI